MKLRKPFWSDKLPPLAGEKVLLPGEPSASLSSLLIGSGASFEKMPWRAAAATESFPAGTTLLLLCAERLKHNDVMGWVAAAGSQQIATLLPAAALPVLQRAGIAPFMIADTPFYRFPAPAAAKTSGFWPRLAALLLLPLWLSLIALFALLLWLSDGRPVFFAQPRVGRDGRLFNIFKFRSLSLPPAVPGGTNSPVPNDHERRHAQRQREADARITRLGGWLRRHGLDELPQFFNLLRGELLLVGPRPLPPDDLQGAAGATAWQCARRASTPGVTGLYQITPQRTQLGLAEMCILDIWYSRNRSPKLDLCILAHTLPAMIARSNGATSP